MKYGELLSQPRDCPFCDTDRREVIGFGSVFLTYSLAPYCEHHLLIIPTRHVESVRDLTKEELGDASLLQQRALGIMERLGHQNSTILVREGADAGKSVAHVHYHVIPDIPIALGGYDRDVLDEHEIAELTATIRQADEAGQPA